jgi:hypothetical protein
MINEGWKFHVRGIREGCYWSGLSEFHIYIELHLPEEGMQPWVRVDCGPPHMIDWEDVAPMLEEPPGRYWPKRL